MTDVVQRWTISGLLRDVSPNNHQYVAERLERAARGVTLKDRERLNLELQALEREGVFGSMAR